MVKKVAKQVILVFLVISVMLTINVADAVSTVNNDKGSNQKDEKLSKDAKRFEEHYGVCEDEELNAKLQRVSERITNILTEDEKHVNLTFKILDDKMVNAFAMPDGSMYFFRGLVELTKSDDQLAGIVAHEIVHVIRKHSKKMADEALPWIIGGMLLGVIAEEPGIMMAGEMVAYANAEKYGRSAEIEADEFGLELLIRAGYDPIGMLEFFGFMVEEEKRNPILFKNYFFVHPFAHERVEKLKDILRNKGYKVPDSLYRSYLESGIEIREESNLYLIDINFGGEVLFTIVGEDEEALIKRAKEITSALDSVLKVKATRFDFRVTHSGERSYIVAKGIILYEPDESDVEYSSLDRKTYLNKILQRIRHQLLEEHIKRRV